MSSIPRSCHECGREESVGLGKLLRCTSCDLVVYCSKGCQVKHWKMDHKECCKSIRSFQKQHIDHIKQPDKSGAEQQVASDQRRQQGTSKGNPYRMDPVAEELSHEARHHKLARRFDRAIFLYTKAIELDPFHDDYHHHRGETWLMAVEHFHRNERMSDLHGLYLKFAVWDAQAALELGPGSHPWLTMINAELDLGDFDQAEEYLDIALRTVPDDAYAMPYLVNYQSQLKQLRKNSVPQCVLVMETKDKYGFAYSKGFHNHRLPELIILDLEVANFKTETENAMKLLFSKTLGGKRLAFGKVFQVRKGPWVTPIPLSIMEDPEATRQRILPMMGTIQNSSSICVLKFDFGSKPDALSLEKAKAYLQIMVDKGKDVPKLYREGKKLVPDEFFSS